MVTPTNILYSIAAVRRMFGLANDIFVRIQEFSKVVWVWIKGKRPTFVSKKDFKQHFVDRRRAEAKGLSVSLKAGTVNIYSVINESKATVYRVCVGDSITCECEDFNNQKKFFGQAACKHTYAVLGHLGFTSLKNYLNRLLVF